MWKIEGGSEVIWIWSGLCKLLQYIGTKDKKGEEIFEGDILKGGCYSGRDKNGVVVKRGHEYFTITSNGISEGCSTEFNSMEIIGNIYENEDLIWKNSITL